MMHTIHSVGLNQDSEDKQVEELKYTVKVINAGTHHGRFSKDQLSSDFSTLLEDSADFLFGYIQRGHGMMSKQFSFTENVIQSMYDDIHVDEDLQAFLLESKS